MKVKHCIDCNKEISRRAERCHSCARKKGRAPAWKGGITLVEKYCLDCGKKINYKSTRCHNCANKFRIPLKGEQISTWKGGVSLVDNRCLDCGKKISYRATRCGSCAVKGKNHPMFGRKGEQSPTWKGGKPKCLDCGKMICKQAIKCTICSKKHKNNPNWKGGRSLIKKYCLDCGKTINWQSTRCLKCAQKGELSSNWQGGKSFDEYPPDFNSQLKARVRVRDNFICQLCDTPELEFNQKLSIHHIDYNRKNNQMINLISLCRKCHVKTNYNRKTWAELFTNKLKQKIEERL